MGSVLLLVLLGAVEAMAAGETCSSGKYTSKGDCCLQCPPGEGMVKPCKATQTVCSPCLDSETYSEVFSHTESCRPCTQCGGRLRMQTPCTDANDAICICDYGYFLNELNGSCDPCTVCPVGRGVLHNCDHDRDTVCEDCEDNTYSDQSSLLDPCLPCTICEEGQDILMQECTPTTDTICKSIYPPPSSYPPSSSVDPMDFTDSSLPVTPPESSTTSTTGSPSSLKPFGRGLNENLIPIYCSILAAVVVGLVAFIIFKRWNSCKQNKQGANNCTVNQTPLPEGEKLHSDSGISVDSQSLQEHQQQMQAHTVVKIDGENNLGLPPHKCEEVEKLLNKGCSSDGMADEEYTDWCSLAGLLGYEEEHIDSFRQEEHPIRALLSDWSSKDCASMEVLCAALRKINREDIAQSLVTATSAV